MKKTLPPFFLIKKNEFIIEKKLNYKTCTEMTCNV